MFKLEKKEKKRQNNNKLLIKLLVFVASLICIIIIWLFRVSSYFCILQKSAIVSLYNLLGDECELDNSSKSDISDKLPTNDPAFGVPADLYKQLL